MRSVAFLFAIFLVFPGASAAQIIPATEGYRVHVTFSDEIESRMDSINSVEQRFEQRFRQHRYDAQSRRLAGTQRFASINTEGTEWAGERLIGEVSEFTLENLVKAMVAYNVNLVVPDFRGDIEVRVNLLKLSNATTAYLDSSHSYALGRFKVTTSDGNIVFDDKVSANLLIDQTVNPSFDGPELAFVETDPSKRVGPTLAYFVRQALRQAWPEHKDAFAGPVIIRVSQSNERLTLN